MAPKDAKRFESKFIRGSPDACWNWVGTFFNTGYGAFWLNGQNRSAPRVSYEQANGSIEDGSFVLHKCDNRACVNPRHLYLGDAAQNATDRTERDRHWVPLGEASPHAKLTEADVKQIIERRRNGETYVALGEAYRVHSETIRQIFRGRSWKHVMEAA